MRVTHKMMLESAIRYMDENLQKLTTLQERISDGKIIHSISDDPATLQTVLTLRSTLSAGRAYLNTANETAGWLEANETALAAAIDTTSRALDLALLGISDTSGSVERQALGSEIGGLLSTALGIANSTYNGSYIFAGFRTQTKPFEIIAGTPDTVAYLGDTGTIVRSLSPGIDMTVNIDGDAVFTPVLSALIGVRDALMSDDTATLQSETQSLRDALEALKETRTVNAARQRHLENIIERIEQAQIDLKSLLSEREDADLAETISLFRNQQTLYNATLESGRIVLNTPNLFELMG